MGHRSLHLTNCLVTIHGDVFIPPSEREICRHPAPICEWEKEGAGRFVWGGQAYQRYQRSPLPFFQHLRQILKKKITHWTWKNLLENKWKDRGGNQLPELRKCLKSVGGKKGFISGEVHFICFKIEWCVKRVPYGFGDRKTSLKGRLCKIPQCFIHE